MSSFPARVRTSSPVGDTRFSLRDPLVDSYFEFVAREDQTEHFAAGAHSLLAAQGEAEVASTTTPGLSVGRFSDTWSASL